RARETAEGLQLVGELAPEMIFAQSLAAEAAGELEQAAARAGVAQQLRQSSSRYRARYANALTRVGRPDEARRVIGAAKDASEPALLAAQARAALAEGSLDAARQAVQGLSEAEARNPSEEAWGALVTGAAHAAEGARGAALEEAAK